jgi:hypothetical protein
VRSGIFLCLVISQVELTRKDKEKFRSAREIPSSGKRPLRALAPPEKSQNKEKFRSARKIPPIVENSLKGYFREVHI